MKDDTYHYDQDEYYDEVSTYKREEVPQYEDYGEEDLEAKRMLIERNIEDSNTVEKPDETMLQEIYENLLKKLVQLLDHINEDDMSFVYKREQQRVYNLLMAVVVNDKKKSQHTC